MSEQTPETPKNSKMGLAIAAGIVVLLVILAVVKFSGKKEDTTPITDTTTPAPNEQTTTASDATYKDGTYTAMGSYNSPGGAETIEITLTLKDGIVTNATAQPQTEQPISKKMQLVFSQNFTSMVVGKNINGVTLDKVSGSSLTPKGFNDAVEQIKTQAKVSA